MAEKDKDNWFYDGQTKETPGMVRWNNDSHYFLKRRRPESKIWILGLENLMGNEAYIYSTSIEFDDDEVPDLFDRIAEFTGHKKYTDLLEMETKLRTLLGFLEKASLTTTVPSRNMAQNIRHVLGED